MCHDNTVKADIGDAPSCDTECDVKSTEASGDHSICGEIICLMTNATSITIQQKILIKTKVTKINLLFSNKLLQCVWLGTRY